MLRYDRVGPFVLPGFLTFAWPDPRAVLRRPPRRCAVCAVEQRSFGNPGVALRDQPFIHGENFSFKSTQNFEFSVSRTTIFGGPGAPVTASTFLRSVFSVSTTNGPKDPGDRRQAVDATYRIPGLRNCLTGYFDGFADDQPFPPLYPTESTWISGFYLRCVPHVPRMTFRAEGLAFAAPRPCLSGLLLLQRSLPERIHQQSPVDWQLDRTRRTWRAGVGHLAISRRGPRFEASYRGMTVNREFLEGGTLRDYSVVANLQLHPEWQLLLENQAEWWRFPLLSHRRNTMTHSLFSCPTGPLGGRNNEHHR